MIFQSFTGVDRALHFVKSLNLAKIWGKIKRNPGSTCVRHITPILLMELSKPENPNFGYPTHHYLLVYHYTTNVACVHLLYIVVCLDRYLHELLWLYSSFYCMHKRIIHGFKYSSSSISNNV